MKKLLPIVVAALVLIATQAFGATAYRYNDSVTTLRGDAVGGASVTVYLAGTTTKATIYLYGSTAVEKSNPTYTDGYGRYFFYAEPGLYDLTIAGSNVITYTVEDVRVFSDTGYTFNVLDYGAVAGDSTDDRAGFMAAIAAAQTQTFGEVFVPPGDYVLSSGIQLVNTNTANQMLLSAYGAEIKMTGSTGTIVEIGDSATTTLNVIVNGGTWRCDTRDWSGTTGIKLLSANRCVLRDVIVGNCQYGITLSGEDGLGTAYNNIYPARVYDCETSILLTASTDGWANSNKFFGGAIQYTSSVDTVDCSAGWAINVATPTNGEHILNDNHFYGQTLEIASTHSAAKPGAVRVFGEYNSFDGIRIERFTAPYYVGITGTIDAGSYYAQRNRIFTGYQADHNFAGTVKDDTGSERLAWQALH
jgi:hypothetical protein